MIKMLKILRGVREQTGEVGIEVEVEGPRLDMNDDKYWTVTGDGSLRGNSAEYVLRDPVPRDEVKEVIDLLMRRHASDLYLVEPSERCGVHIHVNCQELTLRQTFNFAVLYLAFEDVLMRWCGEDREGNLFCLRTGDASHFIPTFARCIKEHTVHWMSGDQFRYASINLGALEKYGSMEFRGMRTPEDLNVIKTWVDILLRLKDKSLQYEKPQQIVEAVSIGPGQFITDALGPYEELVECRDMHQMVVQCIRRIQPAVYAFDEHSHDNYMRKMEKVLDDPRVRERPPKRGNGYREQREAALRQVIAGQQHRAQRMQEPNPFARGEE